MPNLTEGIANNQSNDDNREMSKKVSLRRVISKKTHEDALHINPGTTRRSRQSTLKKLSVLVDVHSSSNGSKREENIVPTSDESEDECGYMIPDVPSDDDGVRSTKRSDEYEYIIKDLQNESDILDTPISSPTVQRAWEEDTPITETSVIDDQGYLYPNTKNLSKIRASSRSFQIDEEHRERPSEIQHTYFGFENATIDGTSSYSSDQPRKRMDINCGSMEAASSNDSMHLQHDYFAPGDLLTHDYESTELERYGDPKRIYHSLEDSAKETVPAPKEKYRSSVMTPASQESPNVVVSRSSSYNPSEDNYSAPILGHTYLDPRDLLKNDEPQYDYAEFSPSPIADIHGGIVDESGYLILEGSPESNQEEAQERRGNKFGFIYHDEKGYHVRDAVTTQRENVDEFGYLVLEETKKLPTEEMSERNMDESTSDVLDETTL